MRNSPTTLKTFCYILSAFILSCFLSCKGDHTQSHKSRTSLPEVKEIKGSKTQIFLIYLDSLLKLPDAKFNEAAIRFLNIKYLSELPLVMYDSIQEKNREDILIQYYKNNETCLERESGIIFLIPKTMTDSLVIADFTHYFGRITSEKPLIGITKQPRPVSVRVSSDREIKLTFKDNINREQAGVTMVEILNYR